MPGRSLTIEVADDKGYVVSAQATVSIRDQSDAEFAQDGLDLNRLDGQIGLTVVGAMSGDASGYSVSGVGDLNGDGIDDLAIGAPNADAGGNTYSGQAFVIFGSTTSVGSRLDVSSLDGSNGFRIDGVAASEFVGRSVSEAGDINGDGIDDLIVGAPQADPNDAENAGSAYVVFGSTGGFEPQLSLSSLDGENGFRLDGVAAGDFASFAVDGAGDLNGDGTDDLIIGAPFADQSGMPDSGTAYVVFGSTNGFLSDFDLSSLDGINGFRIQGVSANDVAGYSVSSAGDIDGDGLGDIVIGARSSSPGTGNSYVLFGTSSGFGSNIELSALNGSDGFRLSGIDPGDFAGSSVSAAGDINDDGVDDLLIGAPFAITVPGGRVGESYVVFGTTSGFAANVDLSSLDGSNGFSIIGLDDGGRTARYASGIGDFNGDGVDDLILSASTASFDEIGAAGRSYVVFGSAAGFGSSLSLSMLNGSNGFRLDGIDGGDVSGRSVGSAGDFNGDGLQDIIVGASNADPNGLGEAGESYVIFGRDAPIRIVSGTDSRDILVGGLGDDTLTGLAGEDRFVISEGDDAATDFTVGQDVIGLEGLLSGVLPADIDDFVELTSSGPDAQFTFDEDGAADFSAGGREGTLTLTGVDFTGSTVDDLLNDGTLWLA